MSYPLKFRQLHYFIAVAEELNFRRAAERLFITQPPLSRQIRQLEDTLGITLLERDRQGVRLTEAGMGFLHDARALVRDSEQALVRAKPPGGAAKTTLTLGITTVIDGSLFEAVGAEFEKRCSRGRVRVKRQTSLESIRDIHRGVMDAAIIGLPSPFGDLAVLPLSHDPMMVCLASSHPAANMPRVSLRDLEGGALFWFNRRLNPAFHDHCEAVFRRLGFHPQRLAEPKEHHILLGLISLGQGVALIPRSLSAMTRKGVVFKELVEGEQLSIRVGVAYQASEAPQALLTLVDILRDQFSKPNDCASNQAAAL